MIGREVRVRVSTKDAPVYNGRVGKVSYDDREGNYRVQFPDGGINFGWFKAHELVVLNKEDV